MIPQTNAPIGKVISPIIAHWQSCMYSLPAVSGDAELSKQLATRGLHALYCCSHRNVVSNAPKTIKIQAKPKRPDEGKDAVDLVVLYAPHFPPSTIVNAEQERHFLNRVESSLHTCQNCVFYTPQAH